MKFLFFEKAFVRGQWQNNVRIAVQHGVLLSLDVGVECGDAEHVRGMAIPAMANVHSHAFQRGFAGMAEYKPAGQSDFWAWRQSMYRFASHITADQLQAIAAQVYLECLLAGYSHIGEFHYLHKAHLSQQQEMAEALFRAADEVGVGLTFLPAHYQVAGFDGADLSPEQQAFSLSLEEMGDLRTVVASGLGEIHRVGHCFHSLRAVPIAFMHEVMQHVKRGEPIHIHIAEQEKEIADCQAMMGKRPVEWLLDNMSVDENWCLVHATHMTDNEVADLAASAAVVGICPTTEANLGDGIFPLEKYLTAGGAIAIGSDSHISRSPVEELRLLEYSQRLSARRRTIACRDDSPHVGTTLWSEASIGGYQALGIKAGEIAVGARADILILDAGNSSLVAKTDDYIFDSLIFAASDRAIKHVMVAGDWQVRAGHHDKYHEITERYKAVMKELMA